ncbi:MAG: PLP-dependent cysteine synthase family protein [Chitinophagales bacterium]
MNYYNNILETIGNTPLIKINHVCKSIRATVLAKVEAFNPGNSTKDRMALKMVENAELTGQLKSGGTIVEATSGNTGFGLALVGAVKGYRTIFTVPDKSSKSKINMLRAIGAEVHVCPSKVKADDPRSYYSVAERLHQEIPNSIFVNQYFNPGNAQGHYESTGPEIWRQTNGRVTHFIAPVGTGGTISGVGKYLKEQNPDVQIIGADAYGSVLTKFHETGILDPQEAYSYLTEGMGKKIIPGSIDFEYIDSFVKITDADGAATARQLAKQEGMFVGHSAGAAVHAVLQLADSLTEDDVVVVLLHDHGSRYIDKIYNDEWMEKHNLLKEESAEAVAMPKLVNV